VNLGFLYLFVKSFKILDEYAMDDNLDVRWEGSPAFFAPELASGSKTVKAFKVEAWAAGVTLYVLSFSLFCCCC
jgi:hypothetical protein